MKRHLDNLVLTAAIAFVAVALLSCSRPRPDYARVPREQLTRQVASGCVASLPLVARSDEPWLVDALLAASAPWSDELGLPVVVPALEGEPANLTIEVQPCPEQFNHRGWCERVAETGQACVGGSYVQEVRIFVPGDALQTFYILMHELGHAVGAWGGQGHSGAPSSIMYPTISGAQGDEAGPDASFAPAQWVMPEDARTARAAWGLR